MTDVPATYVARHIPGVPALGWCATVRRGTPKPEVVLGELVETSADAFFEGVWDGPFPELGFLESPVVMGSGCRVDVGAPSFCSPTHTLDHLYCLADADSVLIANSLPLLLACAGDAPDPRYCHYRADIAALWRGGTKASPIALPTARGQSVLVHAGTDLRVRAADLSIELVDKPQPPEPRDYAAYHETLAGAVQRLVANGTDPRRRTRLHPVATLSSGYDSAASAALGAGAGITDAATLQHTRFDDSGARVAEALGLRLEVLDHEAWRHSDKPLEIEFMASNGGPSVPTLAGFDGHWRAPMILLGSLGDQVWDLAHSLMGDEQSIPDGLSLTQLGLHDFRLRSGITFVHVPAIGAVHAGAIRRISRSAEMEPWTLGTSYDRPVPRRIIEDAGVPRTAFAVRKHAGAAVDPDDVLRPPARADFEEYWHSLVRGLPLFTRWRIRILAHVVTPIGHGIRIVLYRTRWGPLTWRATRRNLGRWYFYRSVPSAYRFHWSIQRLTDQLTAALESGGDADSH